MNKRINNVVLVDRDFFIRTNKGDKVKVEGKIITLKSGEKIGAYKTGVRTSLSNEPYKPCWSISCLKTGYSLLTVKNINYLKDINSIKNLLGKNLRDHKYLLKKFKGDYCNDLRHFR